MKKFRIKYLGILAFLFLIASCEREGIDPITPVEAGDDSEHPVVIVNAPVEGAVINEATELSSININIRVEDDIELQEIVVQVNGQQVATFTEFTDYRIALKTVSHGGLTFGEHTVTVTATDIEGNTTTETRNFSKEPPYTPLFEDEIFYMPFEGNFMDLLSLTTLDQVGTPGFSNDSFEGTSAFNGATDAYLSILLPELGNEFTAAFWYKVDANPTRAGILTATDDADLNQGFRLFREGNATEQRIKLNVGTGMGSSWNDGGILDVTSGEWVHVAFTVTPSGTVIYLNGESVNPGTMSGDIDWTGVNNLVIGSGLNFNGWGHNSDRSLIDELRLFDSALTEQEIFTMVNPPSEELSFYLPFDGNYTEQVSGRNITVVGSPGFAGESKEGSDAYAGAANSYLRAPSTGLTGDSFSATMWYKLDADPNRAGILVMGPEDPDNAGFPDTQNNRKSGFRFFRENGAAGTQRFKLNVGNGTADTWVDGGTAADVPIDAEWIHLAFTISPTTAIVYINGEAVKESAITGIDWTGTDILSIMSGAPRFTGFNHWSDLSYLDELRLYRVALTPQEIAADMGN